MLIAGFYHTGTGRSLSVEEVAAMAHDREDIVVYDAKTGEDITEIILTKHRFH